ncbi:MAG: HisA/HisF-related TIM barrel protein [Planctomycetota bacterium]
MIGVIDLAGGKAVHASGGNRTTYRKTKYFRFPNGTQKRVDGDAVRLAEFFRQADVGDLYIADLDALGGVGQRTHSTRCLQKDLIESLVEQVSAQRRCFLDVGVDQLEGDQLDWCTELSARFRNLRLIVATECADDQRIYGQLGRSVGTQRLAVSLDYRHGRWVSEHSEESGWLEQITKDPPESVIALDTGNVGRQSIEDTLKLAKRLLPSIPECCQFVTGGGVRNWKLADRLFAEGVDAVLVASWFTDAASPSGSLD